MRINFYFDSDGTLFEWNNNASLEEVATKGYFANRPPHQNVIDALLLLKDEENIREMVAFPLGANGADAMMGCPGEVFEKQLRETHIKVRD